MKADLDLMKQQITILRSDIEALEREFPRWNADNIAGAKQPRLIASRIIHSAKRLESLVKENTFSPGTGRD
jgi:hypothetical protein